MKHPLLFIIAVMIITVVGLYSLTVSAGGVWNNEDAGDFCYNNYKKYDSTTPTLDCVKVLCEHNAKDSEKCIKEAMLFVHKNYGKD